MSEYKDFEHCIICRSYQNLEDYNGKYEVTMLLNTLYMTVIKSAENRSVLHVKPRPLVDWLEKNNIVDKQENDYNHDDIIRYLRNGLAHFNIQVNGDGEKITTVLITAKNLKKEPICKQPCEKPKCVPRQLNEKKGSICTFSFSVDQLKKFTEFVIKNSLKCHGIMRCENCPYSTPNG